MSQVWFRIDTNIEMQHGIAFCRSVERNLGEGSVVCSKSHSKKIAGGKKFSIAELHLSRIIPPTSVERLIDPRWIDDLIHSATCSDLHYTVLMPRATSKLDSLEKIGIEKQPSRRDWGLEGASLLSESKMQLAHSRNMIFQ